MFTNPFNIERLSQNRTIAQVPDTTQQHSHQVVQQQPGQPYSHCWNNRKLDLKHQPHWPEALREAEVDMLNKANPGESQLQLSEQSSTVKQVRTGSQTSFSKAKAKKFHMREKMLKSMEPDGSCVLLHFKQIADKCLPFIKG